MFRCLPAIAVLLFGAPAVIASEPPLICFGNEPSWSVELPTPDSARFATPDDEAILFRGGITRNDVLRESVWRGSPAAGRDLVLFLRDAACSDTMSDTEHPVTARVSLPDGRFLAGCCRIPATEANDAATVSLEANSWRLASLSGKESNELAGLERPVWTRFEAGRISGFSGCNNFMGSYTVEGDRVTLGQLAGTLMACTEPAQSIDNVVRAQFAGTLRYEIIGSQLSLTAASGKILTFEQEPEPMLAATTWQVTGFNNNRSAVVGIVADAEISLSFDATTVTANTGCNTARASYSTQGSSIQIGTAASTRRMCAEELMIQEREFIAALESAVKWRIDGNVLDMHRADEERAIFANRVR
jgi:heat shock protein HslJ